MQSKFYILLFILSFFLFDTEIIAQCNGEVNYVNNREELDNCFDNLVTKHDLNVPKVVFTIKIDSLGEIHSCHIRGNGSLTQIKLYSVCCKIECCVNAKFLYEEFKWSFPNEKYVYVYYPYKPK